MEKLDLIIQKINAVPINTTEGKKAKKAQIDYYKENQERLKDISIEYIENFDFSRGVLNKAYNLKKFNYFKKHISKKVLGLNTHKYAPELNALMFKGGTEVKTPQIFEVHKAIQYLIASFTLEQLEKL